MRRVANVVVVIATVLTGAFFASPAGADPWTWNTPLWLQSSDNGQPKYEFRIGAGGAISNINNAQTQEALLSPSYQGEVTDRVVQWTAWCNSYLGPEIQGVEYDRRYNITQAGTSDNVIAPTMSVQMRPGSSVVDVYSVPKLQFNSVYASLPVAQQMQSKISCLTRYEMLEDGVLKVRRVMRVGEVTTPDSVHHTSFDDLYVEAWTPFKRSSSTFTAMALYLDPSDGTPYWWYRAGYNIPFYPETQVDTTYGYAVVYNENAPTTNDAIGVVYGANQIVSPDSRDNAVLNSMDWDTGIGVLPGLHMYGVPTGTIVDQTILLVPSNSLSGAMGSLLASLETTVPAPRRYAPDTTFTGELAGIVATLNANLSETGSQTAFLGDLVTAPEPSSLVLLASGLIGLLTYVWRKRK